MICCTRASSIFTVMRYVYRMDEKDIYRSAKLLIDQHGADASINAAMRIDALIESEDIDGVSVWKRVLRAIEDLRSVEGGTRH